MQKKEACSLLFAFLAIICFLAADPDKWRFTTEQVVRGHGYALENHEVASQDGFILTLQRIPAPIPAVKRHTRAEKTAYPTILVHGFLTNARAFACNGKKSVMF